MKTVAHRRVGLLFSLILLGGVGSSRGQGSVGELQLGGVQPSSPTAQEMQALAHDATSFWKAGTDDPVALSSAVFGAWREWYHELESGMSVSQKRKYADVLDKAGRYVTDTLNGDNRLLQRRLKAVQDWTGDLRNGRLQISEADVRARKTDDEEMEANRFYYMVAFYGTEKPEYRHFGDGEHQKWIAYDLRRKALVRELKADHPEKSAQWAQVEWQLSLQGIRGRIVNILAIYDQYSRSSNMIFAFADKYGLLPMEAEAKAPAGTRPTAEEMQSFAKNVQEHWSHGESNPAVVLYRLIETQQNDYKALAQSLSDNERLQFQDVLTRMNYQVNAVIPSGWSAIEAVGFSAARWIVALEKGNPQMTQPEITSVQNQIHNIKGTLQHLEGDYYGPIKTELGKYGDKRHEAWLLYDTRLRMLMADLKSTQPQRVDDWKRIGNDVSLQSFQLALEHSQRRLAENEKVATLTIDYYLNHSLVKQ